MKTKEEVEEIRRVPMPTYNEEGLGQCVEDKCQQYDGSRCRLLGFPPSSSCICEPWAMELLAARELAKAALEVAVRWLRAHGLTGGVETVERVLAGEPSPLPAPVHKEEVKAFVDSERKSGRTVPITPVPEDSHRERHVILHEKLDELLADFMANTHYRPSETVILALMEWSHTQMVFPDHEDSA